MGLLLTYAMEDKEHSIDLLDTHLVKTALIVGMIQASITCLLLKIFLATYLWS